MIANKRKLPLMLMKLLTKIKYQHLLSQSEDDDNASDNESMMELSDKDSNHSTTSDLSYSTNVDVNEYNEYNALFDDVSDDPENIRQEFPSDEFAEFIHTV
jgi:hypothetical protein